MVSDLHSNCYLHSSLALKKKAGMLSCRMMQVNRRNASEGGHARYFLHRSRLIWQRGKRLRRQISAISSGSLRLRRYTCILGWYAVMQVVIAMDRMEGSKIEISRQRHRIQREISRRWVFVKFDFGEFSIFMVGGDFVSDWCSFLVCCEGWRKEGVAIVESCALKFSISSAGWLLWAVSHWWKSRA